jgi:hypothetical protein
MLLASQHFRWVSPGYFETIHLPLIAGRFLTPGDEGKRYTVVSELAARFLWPGKDPIGQQFSRGGNDNETPFTVKATALLSLFRPVHSSDGILIVERGAGAHVVEVLKFGEVRTVRLRLPLNQVPQSIFTRRGAGM